MFCFIFKFFFHSFKEIFIIIYVWLCLFLCFLEVVIIRIFNSKFYHYPVIINIRRTFWEILGKVYWRWGGRILTFYVIKTAFYSKYYLLCFFKEIQVGGEYLCVYLDEFFYKMYVFSKLSLKILYNKYIK